MRRISRGLQKLTANAGSNQRRREGPFPSIRDMPFAGLPRLPVGGRDRLNIRARGLALRRLTEDDHSVGMSIYTVATNADRSGWNVFVKFENGGRHTILGFKTEAEARAWIAESERVEAGLPPRERLEPEQSA